MAIGDIVKVVFVRIKVDGAEKARADMADIAARAREIGQIDPTIKVNVDKDALAKLAAMRLELRALSGAGDKAGLSDLAGRLRAFGAGAEGARLKLAALRLEMLALRGAADTAAADAGKTGGGLLGGLPGPLSALGKLPPQAQIAAIAAALLALPFIAQAVAGAITFALGGAITAVGVMFAAKNPKIAAEWKSLTATMSADLTKVSQPFVGALDVIIKVARALLPEVMAPLGAAMKAIAGPFTTFATSLLAAFAQPAVGQAIVAVANAFGGILKALSPQLAGDIRAVANGITEIANAVAKNPAAFAAFISFFFRLAGAVLTGIAYLTQVATYIEQHFLPTIRKLGQLSGVTAALKIVLDLIAAAWKLTMDLLQGHWRKAWNDIRAFGIQVWNSIRDTGVRIWHEIDSLIGGILDGMRHHIANIFDGVRHDIAHYWDMIWNNTVGRVGRGISDVVGWFKGLPGRIISALSSLPGILFQAGANAISHLISGLLSMLGPLGSAVGSIVSKITSFFGLSPAKEGPLSGGGSMEIRGRHIARDLARGMTMETASVGSAAGLLARSAVPGYGAGTVGAGGMLRIQWVGGPSGALEQAMWTWFRERVRITGGGGPQSVQRALGQVWR